MIFKNLSFVIFLLQGLSGDPDEYRDRKSESREDRKWEVFS
jgi:hypothetical protein